MHEIESLFSVKDVPWHGLGTILEDPPTVEDAIRLAGLDWKVECRPVYAKLDGQEIETDHVATIRDSDKSVLGVVGKNYKPLQNADAFKFFQPFLDSKEAVLDTAGSLRDGKRVWVLARLARDPVEVVPGDAIRKYVLLSNGHDGSLAVRVGFSGIRVVCANTMAMAHDDAGSKLLSIRHTKHVNDALDKVREAMVMADQSFEATIDQLKAMARKGVEVADLKALVTEVFRPKATLKNADEEAADCERLMGKIIPLFEHGRGNDMPGVAGTAYGAYNAVVEFLQYYRGKDDGGRLDSLWFGDSARLNQRAFQAAIRMSA